MWKNYHRFACFFFYLFSFTAAKKSYEGGVVLRINLTDEKESQKYAEIVELFDSKIEGWSDTDIFVPDASTLTDFSTKLQQHELSFETIIHDVDSFLKDVDAMNQAYEKRTRLRRSVDGNSLISDVVGRYATYDEIMDWLRKMAESNEDIMELHTIGGTYEDRDLVLVKLGLKSTVTKPAIWIDFGIHAREWIAPATATYIIQQFLEGWQTDNSEITHLLEAIDFYLLPVTNPDGYVYSHEKERFWRKNRGPDYNNTGCIGTDLNRNFAHHWREVMIVTSSNQCSILFSGPAPESELETKAIVRAVQALGANLKVYLSVHSYSQLWLTGWCYTDQTSDIHDQEIALGTIATDAIFNTTGMIYRVGPSPQLMYKFSGGSTDWAKGAAGIKYSFCVELRDRGKFGFLLPAEQILDTGAELLAAVRAMSEYIAEEAEDEPNFYQPKDEDTVTLDIDRDE